MAGKDRKSKRPKKSARKLAPITKRSMVLESSQEINQVIDELSQGEGPDIGVETFSNSEVTVPTFTLVEVHDVDASLPNFAASEITPDEQIIEVLDSDEETRDVITVELPKPAMKRGPKHSVVWQSFVTMVDGSGKVISNTCKKCKTEVSARPGRMEEHLKSCNSKLSKTPSATVTSPQNFHWNAPLDSQVEAINLCTRSSPANITGHSPATSSISGFVRSIRPDDKTKMDLALGKMIFASNLSFNLVEHSSFLDFCRLLNPAYRPPSHDVIGGRILEQVYCNLEESSSHAISAQKVVLSQDGWSAVQSAPVIAHSLSTGNKHYFLEAVATGERKKDAQYCFELWEKAKVKAENNYRCKVVGAITDNCNTMKALQSKIQENFPGLMVYGCQSHLLNLVGKHFTKASIQAEVQSVHVYMRNHYYTNEKIKALGMKRPILPGSTRWNSQIDSFLCFLENQTKYIDVLREVKNTTTLTAPEKRKLEEVLQIISRPDLYDELKHMVQTLRPVALSLDKLQNNSSSVSDAVKCWLEMETEISSELLNDPYVSDIRDQALNGTTLAAYIIDPRFCGEGLSKVRMEKGLEWLGEKSGMLVILATELQQKSTEHFISAMLKDEVRLGMAPALWWRNRRRIARHCRITNGTTVEYRKFGTILLRAEKYSYR